MRSVHRLNEFQVKEDMVMKKMISCFLVILAFMAFTQKIHADIIYLKGGGLLKGDITKKEQNTISVKIEYGEISVSRAEIDRITSDSDPDAVYDLAKYYVERDEWDKAVDEFDNLLLLDPNRKSDVLEFVSDLNFSRSGKERMQRFESITEAYQMIDEGKKLVNFGKKQLKYNTRFKDYEWQKEIQSIGRANIQRGENLIRKGQSIVDSYHRQREEEIKRAREKAEQEQKGK